MTIKTRSAARSIDDYCKWISATGHPCLSIKTHDHNHHLIVVDGKAVWLNDKSERIYIRGLQDAEEK